MRLYSRVGHWARFLLFFGVVAPLCGAVFLVGAGAVVHWIVTDRQPRQPPAAHDTAQAPIPAQPATPQPTPPQPATQPPAIATTATSAAPPTAPPATPPAPPSAVPPAPANPDTVAAANPPPSPGPSLVVHYPASSEAAAANAKQLAAEAAPQFGRTELDGEADAPPATTIRYFFAEDHAAARDIGGMLGRMGLSWHLENQVNRTQKPPQGTIEVSIAGR